MDNYDSEMDFLRFSLKFMFTPGGLAFFARYAHLPRAEFDQVLHAVFELDKKYHSEDYVHPRY